MDPLWALATEFWWIAPTVVGAGTLGAIGLRRRSTVNGKRLAYDAARLELQAAQKESAARRLAVKVARAEHARVVAERSVSRATGDDVARARRELRQAEQSAKAAAADVRFRKVRMNVARVEIGGGSDAPLARLHASYDAVTARWLDYETDPAKRIAFPSLSDGKDPAMGAFLAALDRAQSLRPAADQKRVTPAEFAAYRDAVTELERAFDAAERAARARAGMTDPADTSGWQDAAQSVITRSADVFDRAAGAAASAFAAWNARDRSSRGSEKRADDGMSADAPSPPAAKPDSSSHTEQDPPPAKAKPIWPVPRRDGS